MSDIKDPSQEQKALQNQKPARRSFLKKAAVGATIASIPSHSVWAGRLISGNMSGNVSGWAQECELVVHSHGGWKNNFSSFVPDQSFYNTFLGDVIIASGLSVSFQRNGITFPIKLSDILSSESGLVFEEYVPDVISTNPITGEVTQTPGTPTTVYTASISSAITFNKIEVKETGGGPPRRVGDNYKYTLHVAGPSNVNIQLISVFLSGALTASGSGSAAGVNWPVIGPGKPFSSIAEYADYLYAAALSNPSLVGSELSEIIDTYKAASC